MRAEPVSAAIRSTLMVADDWTAEDDETRMAPATGGCFCGRVRYAIRGEPFQSTFCHCASCRRAAGAPVVAWLTVRQAEFAFVDLPGEIDITTASLDDPEQVPPEDETHVAERLGWLALLDRLPTFPATRG